MRTICETKKKIEFNYTVLVDRYERPRYASPSVEALCPTPKECNIQQFQPHIDHCIQEWFGHGVIKEDYTFEIHLNISYPEDKVCVTAKNIRNKNGELVWESYGAKGSP